MHIRNIVKLEDTRTERRGVALRLNIRRVVRRSGIRTNKWSDKDISCGEKHIHDGEGWCCEEIRNTEGEDVR